MKKRLVVLNPVPLNRQSSALLKPIAISVGARWCCKILLSKEEEEVKLKGNVYTMKNCPTAELVEVSMLCHITDYLLCREIDRQKS